jgi:hypothetical protein
MSHGAEKGSTALLRCAKPVLLLVFFLYPATFPPALLHADEFRLLPTIAEKFEYNDNLFVVPTSAPAYEKLHDFISTTSGGLHLLANTETLNVDFTGRVDQLLYLDNPNLDSTDQFYKASLGYAVNPKLSFSLRGEYNRDSRPDRDLYTSGLVVSAARRELSTEGFTANYALTDKTLSSLSYDHGEYWYRSPHFVDMTYDAASLSFARDLTDFLNNTKGRFNLGYMRYDFTGLTVDNYEATTGFEYALHEKWTFLVDGGARYTESAFQALQIVGVLGPYVFVSSQNVTSTGTAAIGTAMLSYRGESTTANLKANRDIMPAYGALGTVERTAVTLSINHKFTYELSGGFWGGYFTNISKNGQFAATAIDFDSWYVTPNIRYDFNRDMYLEGSYTFVKVVNNISVTTAYRNQVMLRFCVQHAILE